MTPPMTPREKVVDVIRNRIEADDNAQNGGTSFDNAERTKYAYVDIGEFDLGALASDILTALASGSGDHAELARLAEAAKAVGDPFYSFEGVAEWGEFQAAANPATVLALLAEIAALRESISGHDRQVSGMLRARLSAEARATEAERKLADVDGLLIEIADAPQPKDTGGRFFRAMSSINAYVARLNASKEAERG